MNSRRRRGNHIIYKENEEYRALGYTSIDGVKIREDPVEPDGNRPIREETANPFNESVVETKHR